MEANLEAVEPVAVLELLGDAIDSTNAEDVLGQVAGFAEAHRPWCWTWAGSGSWTVRGVRC